MSSSKTVTLHSASTELQLDAIVDQIDAPNQVAGYHFRMEEYEGMYEEGILAHVKPEESQIVSFILCKDVDGHNRRA